jgi:hypothetical protein
MTELTMFKDLPEEEQRELVWHRHLSTPIEYLHQTDWVQAVPFGAMFNPTCAYRLALTQPSANWSHVHPDYNWLARDKDDCAYFYAASPTKVGDGWIEHFTFSAKAFTSYKPGTCDWKDSLVQRPEGE